MYEEILEGFVKKRKDPLTSDEIISIIFNAGLTDKQMISIMSDLRAKI